MDFSVLNKFSLFGSSDHHEHQLQNEDRVRISRSRRAIELQDQELIQLALLEERWALMASEKLGHRIDWALPLDRGRTV